MWLWDAVNVICIITLPTLLVGYLPLRRRRGISLWRLILLAASIVFVNLVLAAVVRGLPAAGLARISISFLGQLLIALLAALLARQSLYLQLLVVFVCKSYTDNVRLAAAAITARFFPGHCLPLVQLLILCATLPFLYSSIRRYLWSVFDRNPDETLWKYLCLIPIGLFLIFRVAISPEYLWPGTSCADAPLLLSLVWPVSAFLSFFAVLRAYCIAAENAQLQSKVYTAGMVVSAKAEQNARLKQSADRTREEQAQLSGQLQALQRRLRAGDLPGVRGLLADSLGHLARLSADRLCENAAVDGIVRRYQHWAEKYGVRMEVRLLLPARLPIPEIDFFVVLGNLLENALEACVRQEAGERFLHLKSAAAGRDGLLLSVRNSYGRDPLLRDGVYLSSKRNGGPGLGLASVRAVAEKYGGLARFTHGGGIFEASVLLNAPLAGEEGGRRSDV